MLGLPYRALVLERQGRARRRRRSRRGRPAEARASADLQLLVPALAAGALVAAARDDDSDGALDLVHELIEVTRGRPIAIARCSCPSSLGCARRRTRSTLLVELADGLTVELGRVGSARTAAAAVLAEAEKRVPEALALYEQAAKRWRDFGCAPGRAEALLGQGRCLISLEKRGAEEPLAEAHDLFASMGHRAGLAEAENLLAVGPPQ